MLNKKKFFLISFLSVFLISFLPLYIIMAKNFFVTSSKIKSISVFFTFLFGVFFFIYQIPNCFVDEKELKEASIQTFRVELCNFDFSKIFICISIPLVRISFYENFFVIVIFFKVFNLTYEQIVHIEKRKIKFSEKIVLKTTNNKLKEFSIYSINQEQLYSILIKQWQKNYKKLS